VTGGRLHDLQIDPKNPAILYVGAASGGIWKSTNKGITWTDIFGNQPDNTFGSLAIFERDSNIIWAGTGENNNRQSSSWGGGVYRSTDAGRTWRQVNSGLADPEVAVLAINPAHPQTLFRALAVDAAFDVEQRVDALDRFERDRRDRRRVLAAPGIGRDVRELEELPPSMRPAKCGGDRPLRTRGIVQLVVAAIGVGLQDTGEAVKVARGMLMPAIARGARPSRSSTRSTPRWANPRTPPPPRARPRDAMPVTRPWRPPQLAFGPSWR